MLKPLNKRVFGVFPPEEKKGTLILMPEMDLNKTELIVMSVSEDIDDIQVGDRVIIKKYAGTEIDGELCGLVVEHKDILAIISALS